MALTSTITGYNDRWPTLFNQEADRLRPLFGETLVDLHHVGSTAVVGLAAKPEIDILVVVNATEDLDLWEGALKQLGYRRGGDLSAGHHFFKRDVEGVRTHKLHVCLVGHPQISRMLKVRDHLRSNDKDREAYKALKLQLEKESQTGIAEYLNGKAPFLDELYQKVHSTE
ncbi:GrpB family protein [Pelagibius sp.]|uniref:GrpB family protein n=1 Tax=Pelagibius sp. TaxID=1931238 RepID=UPI003BB0F416